MKLKECLLIASKVWPINYYLYLQSNIQDI